MTTSMRSMLEKKLEEQKHEARAIAATAKAENRKLTVEEDNRAITLLTNINALEERMTELRDVTETKEAAETTLRELADSPVVARFAGELRSDKAMADKFRSSILDRNPAPIDVRNEQPRTFYQPGVEARTGLMTSAPANASFGVGFYRNIVMNLVETSSVLRAGATVIETNNGEPMRVPHQTAYSTATITAEGTQIAEADPTFASVTLNAYKYAVLISVSNELAEDAAFDLAGYLATQAGVALGNAFGADILNGSGSGAPTGCIGQATLGVTGPTGTATSFGTQGTTGQGTDLVNSLVGSLAEPYTRSPAFGILARTATITSLRNLKSTQGTLVGNDFIQNGPAPFYVDPFVPSMAANAKSLVCGDWSKVFVRLVNGIRFEQSREYAFANDQTVFRAILRADSALVDTAGALKYFAHSAT